MLDKTPRANERSESSENRNCLVKLNAKNTLSINQRLSIVFIEKYLKQMKSRGKEIHLIIAPIEKYLKNQTFPKQNLRELHKKQHSLQSGISQLRL
uniref:Uncharacterized protein n=1 Tax=Octopus bimaculoides TaxID=37653 RepID=A0A0L8FPG9_OCTBM